MQRIGRTTIHRRTVALGLAATLGTGFLAGANAPAERIEQANRSVAPIAVATIPVADADQVVGGQRSFWPILICVALTGASPGNPLAGLFADVCWKIVT